MNANKFRQMVSLKKKRFQEEGFDLDLTYITPKIIAFGYPAVGREAYYRNPKEEVIRFFDKFHDGKYYIYNLCAEPERQYKAKIFHDRVAKFQFFDHNAPPLAMMPRMCEHAADWLKADEENVVGIHCKAGKGRTGVMISILLVYLGMYDTVDEAMKFYGEQRTYNGKGVTIPSQIRYIRYFGRTKDSGFVIPSPPMVLVKKITIRNIETFAEPEKLHIMIEVITNWTTPERPFVMTRCYSTKTAPQAQRKYIAEEDCMEFDLGAVPVCGDVRVVLFTGNASKKERFCWFWFHSAFVEKPFVIQKKEIDKAAKEKEEKQFLDSFTMEMDWEPSMDSSELDTGGASSTAVYGDGGGIDGHDEVAETSGANGEAGDDDEGGGGGEEKKRKRKKKDKKRPKSDHAKGTKSEHALSKSASDSGVVRKKKKKKKSSGLRRDVTVAAMESTPNGQADEDADAGQEGAAVPNGVAGDGGDDEGDSVKEVSPQGSADDDSGDAEHGPPSDEAPPPPASTEEAAEAAEAAGAPEAAADGTAPSQEEDEEKEEVQSPQDG